MDKFCVMVTEANGFLGFEIVRQLISLSNPPDYVFASFTKEENLEELKKLVESTEKSQLILFKMNCEMTEDIDRAKATIRHATENRELDFIINIIPISNYERDNFMTHCQILKSIFHAYTLPSLLLFQKMLPFLETAAASKKHFKPNSRSVFYNIFQENSACSNTLLFINKIALNLALVELAKKSRKHVSLLSTCIDTNDVQNRNPQDSENIATSMLFQVFSSSQSFSSQDTSKICEL